MVQFLATHWIPWVGNPEFIVSDQGGEFSSDELDEFCHSRSINVPGRMELLGAAIRVQTCTGSDEMIMAVAEATAADNGDINEEGVSSLAETGRQQHPVGNVLKRTSWTSF